MAEVDLRWQAVQLRDPDRQGAAVPLNVVHVREENAPEGVARLEWFLLTSLAEQTRQDAERMLEWYRLRWRIEDWHRVLKSGCKVEYLGHRRGERIERAVTINAVIAWRLAAMTLIGAGHAGTAAGDVLLGDRDRGVGGFRQGSSASTAGQSRTGGADTGDAGRVSQLQTQALCPPGPQGHVGRLHTPGGNWASHRTGSSPE